MESICGLDCNSCPKPEECKGCVATDGHPFGGICVAAECIKGSDAAEFLRLKYDLIKEINALKIKHLKIDDLNLLNGFFVNVEYSLDNGTTFKLLNDNDIYLGNQVDIPDSDRCYGVAADAEKIIVSEYGKEGKDPELVIYKKRIDASR